jgi:hypothetical protein
MRTAQAAALAALTLALGALAYELTMTATLLGGYLPLAFITAAPVLGFALGRAA